jgi:CHAT domain
MAADDVYDELEIELGSVTGGFESRVLKAAFGRGAAAPFVPPAWTAGLPEVVASIERRIRAGAAAQRDVEVEPRDQEPADWDPKKLGRDLFDALFIGEVAQRLRESLAALDVQPEPVQKRGLRLRLTFDSQDDLVPLATLPWELLRERQQFLALDWRLVRSHNQRTRPRTVPAAPLRVLLLPASTPGQQALQVSREADRIRATLARNANIEVLTLVRPGVRRLQETLLDSPFHILHFMGHGGLRDDPDQDFVLWFEDDDGRPEPVTGELLAELIKNAPRLRLVVLNACWGGALPRRRGQDPFTGVAAALMGRDIPAVVAMQFPISDRAAIAFSDAFYARLAAGDGVSGAVTAGRREIFLRQPDSLEWATPVVFLAGSDQLFELSVPRTGEGGAVAPGAQEPAQSGAVEGSPGTVQPGEHRPHDLPPPSPPDLPPETRSGWTRWMARPAIVVLVSMILLALGALLLPRLRLASPGRIGPEDARRYAGQTKRVCGFVVQAKYADSAQGQPTFLDFGKPFPDEAFRIVIWGEDRAKFSQPPETTYLRENVCVDGTIDLFGETPEVVVHDPLQLLLDRR